MKKLFLSVGDLSGDIHCGKLVNELLQRHPDWKIGALGGVHTQSAGAQIIGDTTGLGVIGFVSAVAILPRSLRLKKAAIEWIDRKKPDVAILCDWGGFNTRFIPHLQKRGIPIFYYFPPRSWQKSGDGGLQVAQTCQKIATPFEWSAERLKAVGGDATWVGHPMLETLRALPSREALRREFNIADDQKLMALLPGSRALELKYIAQHVVGAVEILKRDPIAKNLKFAIASSAANEQAVRQVFGDSVQIVVERSLELLRASDAAIVKSGTSTLEAAVAGVPQVIVYDVPKIIRAQVNLTGMRKKMDFVGMPNIMLGHEVAPELILENCLGAPIAEIAKELLIGGPRTAKMRQDYDLIREALGETLPYSATAKTADLVEQMLG